MEKNQQQTERLRKELEIIKVQQEKGVKTVQKLEEE